MEPSEWRDFLEIIRELGATGLVFYLLVYLVRERNDRSRRRPRR